MSKKAVKKLLVFVCCAAMLIVSTLTLAACGEDKGGFTLTGDGCTVTWETQGEGLEYTLTAADAETGETTAEVKTAATEVDLSTQLSPGRVYNVTVSYPSKKDVVRSKTLILRAAYRLAAPYFAIEREQIMIANYSTDSGQLTEAEGYLIEYKKGDEVHRLQIQVTLTADGKPERSQEVYLPIKEDGDYDICVTALGDGVKTLNSLPSFTLTAYLKAIALTPSLPMVVKTDETAQTIELKAPDTDAEAYVSINGELRVFNTTETAAGTYKISLDGFLNEGQNKIFVQWVSPYGVSEKSEQITITLTKKALPAPIVTGSNAGIYIRFDEDTPASTIYLETNGTVIAGGDITAQSTLQADAIDLVARFSLTLGKEYTLNAYLKTRDVDYKEQSDKASFVFTPGAPLLDAPDFQVKYDGVEFIPSINQAYEIGITDVNAELAEGATEPEEKVFSVSGPANKKIFQPFDFMPDKVYKVRVGLKDGKPASKRIEVLGNEDITADLTEDDGFTVEYPSAALIFTADGKTFSHYSYSTDATTGMVTYKLDISKLANVRKFTAAVQGSGKFISSAPVEYQIITNPPFSYYVEQDKIISLDQKEFYVSDGYDTYSSTDGAVETKQFSAGTDTYTIYSSGSIAQNTVNLPYAMNVSLTKLSAPSNFEIIEEDGKTILGWSAGTNFDYYDVKLEKQVKTTASSTPYYLTLTSATVLDNKFDITEFVESTRGMTLRLTVKRHSNNYNTLSADAAMFEIYNPKAPVISLSDQYYINAMPSVRFASDVPENLTTRYEYTLGSSSTATTTTTAYVSMTSLNNASSRKITVNVKSDETNYLSSPKTSVTYAEIRFPSSNDNSVRYLLRGQLYSSLSSYKMYSPVGKPLSGMPTVLSSNTSYRYYLSNNTTEFADGINVSGSSNNNNIDLRLSNVSNSNISTDYLWLQFPLYTNSGTEYYYTRNYRKGAALGQLPQRYVSSSSTSSNKVRLDHWYYVNSAGTDIAVNESSTISAGETRIEMKYMTTTDNSSFESNYIGSSYYEMKLIEADDVNILYVDDYAPSGSSKYRVTSIGLSYRSSNVNKLYIPYSVTNVTGLNNLTALTAVYVDEQNPVYKSVNGKLCLKDGTVVYDPTI